MTRCGPGKIHLDSHNKLFIWGANPPFIFVRLQMILVNENISIEQVRFTSKREKTTCKNSVKLQDNRPRGPVSKDEFNAKFEKHIAENVAKGSALCPLGSTFINDSNKGGFQLIDLIITKLKSHMTCKNSIPLEFVSKFLSLVEITAFRQKSKSC